MKKAETRSKSTERKKKKQKESGGESELRKEEVRTMAESIEESLESIQEVPNEEGDAMPSAAPDDAAPQEIAENPRIEFTSTVEEEELRVQSITHKIDLALAKSDLTAAAKNTDEAEAALDAARRDVAEEVPDDDFDEQAERGRLLTKASLINRLEYELSAVEQQLAAIDQLRIAHPVSRKDYGFDNSIVRGKCGHPLPIAVGPDPGEDVRS